ncbi:hypothetical protein EPO05_05200 [Patescibacteria group bacterium]|nr:MAG: hypothetical protein EPO05_05200 [Patescibacteria group bacterium]
MKIPLHLQVRLNDVVARERRKPTTQAIFVGGSMARGTADKFSDIDVLVLTTGQPRFIRYYDRNLDIEVETVTLASMKKKLAADPATWYAWQNLKPLFDPSGQSLAIRRLLKSFQAQYCTPDQIRGDQYIRLRHWRQKCLRSLSDAAKARALVSAAMIDICRSQFALRNVIIPPTAQILSVSLDHAALPKPLKRLMKESLLKGLAPRRLVPTIEALLPKLQPVMRRYHKFYRPWR